ncbi:MAG: hypothetical protein M1829_002169 [Trizodia sp. TS-e1964]|nr:MAG: hypothetical protein M1829_002169 [Trizodia sp. TS-e1964]
MQLFLLPLSRQHNLIYCQRLAKIASERKLVDLITARVSRIWLNWENSNTRWQQTLTRSGNRLLQRIPYEEWGLKSIPPLSPGDSRAGKTEVKVLFPSWILDEEEVPRILSQMAAERQTLDARRLWICICAIPFTLPLALIPLVPNIPFFYLAYRAWSHWRALAGSRHLEHLLKHNLARACPSPMLNMIYTAGLRDPREGSGNKVPEASEASALSPRLERAAGRELGPAMLIQRWNARLIAEAFAVPELTGEMDRAIGQVEQAVPVDTESST